MPQMLVNEPMRERVPLSVLLAREDFSHGIAADRQLYQRCEAYRREWQRLQLHAEQAICFTLGDLRDFD